MKKTYYIIISLLLLLLAANVSAETNKLINPDFETGDLTGWTVIEGDAFKDVNITNLDQGPWFGKLKFKQNNDYHLWGYIIDKDKDGSNIYDRKNKSGDDQTGILRSNKFVLAGNGEISFLLGGGSNTEKLYVALKRVKDNKILKKATGPNIETYSKIYWDASKYLGEEVYIEVVDKAVGPMGHLNIDNFDVFNQDADQIVDQLSNPNFKIKNLDAWLTSKGNSFSLKENNDFEAEGYYLFSGEKSRKSSIKSHNFKIAGNGKISFDMKSSGQDKNIYVELIRNSDNKILFKTSAAANNVYKKIEWDALEYFGEEVYLKVVDDSQKNNISIDNFETSKETKIAHWSFEADQETLANYQKNKGKTKLKPKVIDSAADIEDDIEYVFNKAEYKPSTPPMWRKGIKGDSLFFDGYSNFIRRLNKDVPKPTDKLSIEAWIAPKAFEWGDNNQLSAIINQHNRFKMTGYILGIGRHGRWSFQVGTGKKWIELWADKKNRLPKDKWSYVSAVFDGKNKSISLYLNGKLIASKKLEEKMRISRASEPLLIGRHNQAVNIGPFSVNMFSGLLDELKVYNRVLTAKEITNNYQKNTAEINNPDLEFKRSRYEGDKYRPQYHFIAPAHWMNEPHAPMYYDPDPKDDEKGKYHLFYQHNPFGPFWHQIHWGHAVSKDLVHWEDAEIAIAPQEPVTPDGVWSGDSVISPAGDPLLFFTAGDDKRGKYSDKTNQNIGLAEAVNPKDEDLNDWKVYDSLVIEQTKRDSNLNALSFGQFRDPFVWKDDKTGDYYQLVGTGLIGRLGGTTTLYRATDEELKEWDLIGNLYESDPQKYPIVSHVWELPVLLPLNNEKGNKTDKYILLFSPYFKEENPLAVKFVPYWVGELTRNDNEIITGFKPDHEEPRLFDYGENFTGPSGFVTPDGRSILFSIAQGKRTPEQHYNSGWAHNAGLPLNLYLEKNKNKEYELRINPIRELKSLRKKKMVDIEDMSLKETNKILREANGDCLEIILEISPQNATKYGIKVRKSPDSKQETLIYYNENNSEISIDRSKSSQMKDVAKGIQGGEMKINNENLRLHIYLDHSMVEVYANNKKSLTSRVYPDRNDADGLHIFSDQEIIIKNMKVYKLGTAYKNN